MKSSAAAGDSCNIHSSSPLPVSPHQVQGMSYFESEMETDVAALQMEISTATLELETDAIALELELNLAALKLETYATALNLEMEIDMPQGPSKQ
jgi:uncharacterized membrane protein